MRRALPLLVAMMFWPQALFAHDAEAGRKGTATGKETVGGEDASGHEEKINTEHIFGFVDGSDIGEKGEREIESNTVGRFGRIGSYNQIDTETSFRYTLTDRLRLSIGTLTDYSNIDNVPGFANLAAVSFGGVIGEVRVNVLDRETAPFGLSVSLNPQWRQFDPDSGARAQRYAIPLTFLADKVLIPETFVVGSSFAVGQAFQRTGEDWQNSQFVTATVSGSYQIVKRLFLAAEIRHETTFINGDLVGHALYVGPSFLYQVMPNLDFKVAWAIQVPDVGTHSLDLTTYDRHQVLVHVAYSF